MHSIFRKFNRTQFVPWSYNYSSMVCSTMHNCTTAPIAEVGVAN